MSGWCSSGRRLKGRTGLAGGLGEIGLDNEADQVLGHLRRARRSGGVASWASRDGSRRSRS